ncbi:glycoside hydrolase family 55 protein [Rhodococcus pyridinivorans]|uniref:glycoside hydrolase family 55 protein n=1 Tax=Rhodococcus pyridinivorans TaxID=103816 RepID=UPI00207862CC|nr:glycoside hydrolase family 55 protein [Rhodococcus pyridinivorans]USI91348.1 glycoside hydrolase family 55 protein [Rhodococcus pyridinivorans]
MADEVFNRRKLLTASLSVATVLPLACSSQKPVPDVEREAPEVSSVSQRRNVRDFGAVGDGMADDTEAVARAAAASDGPAVLYLPAGYYRVTAWPDLPDFSTVTGDGGDVTIVFYEGNGTLISLHDRHRVRFARLGVYLTGPEAIAVSLSGSFRCSFDSVVLRGSHLSENFPLYRSQQGVVLEENTGGTTFVDCDINNFGIGVVTSCIQNYLTASKLTNNYVGVLGTGNDHNAGLSLTDIEFVSDNDPRTTDKHIRIDGAANNWWLTNVWFEGADIALSVGERGRGGPSQLGLVNCKIAARSVCLDLIHCRQPYLANVRFDPDTEVFPTELRIDPEGCPEGTAVNLISSASTDIDPAAFPIAWNVVGRGVLSGGTFAGTVVTRSVGDDDLLQAQNEDGETLSAILADGSWLSDRPGSGPILRDEDGRYWRLRVTTDGRLGTEPLGARRPRG